MYIMYGYHYVVNKDKYIDQRNKYYSLFRKMSERNLSCGLRNTRLSCTFDKTSFIRARTRRPAAKHFVHKHISFSCITPGKINEFERKSNITERMLILGV